MATIKKASLRSIHRHSWVSLLVCWMIWILNAYDREIVLRLGPTISKHFDLSADQWGTVATVVMLALALLDIPGSMWSDRYGGGWKRARFQVPLVLGYTAISFLSGFKALSGNLATFIALRVGVNLGAGWGEPVGVSNTAEWWPVERRGFALGAHHTGYPIGAMLSGIVASFVITVFGEDNWRYVFFFAFVVALPLMIFWARYSTAERITALYVDIAAKGMTPPDNAPASQVKGEAWRTFVATLRNRNIALTAGNTMLTQVVYMGVNIVLPAYLYNIAGLSLAESAGMSVVFTLTGILGQLVWPSLSDIIGRRTTLIICGLWMAASVGAFYFANTLTLIIVVQLLFGLVANAVWPIYYAVACDSAEPSATSTANGIITTAMFIGGGLAPVLMGSLIAMGGGWTTLHGYTVCFFVMAGCALGGALLQLFSHRPQALVVQLDS
ncbi:MULTISPECIES: MFS transporter [Pseudomonas]|uniref:MFS transporter n=2 Tax=Pseudomonas fluorescens group TaxID=136843 RepID=A0A9X5QIV2_PSEMA|nr:MULTISPECIES: MFS transporter [Pseudomonas]KJZ51604.1 MFS transporter [Pseudomonas marginalis]KJZ60787.1 MFS transporter [Pseudomonas marginalis]MCD7041658.1 MFS transporter [Pseudomonas petroselini]MCD7043283.1 MFS transporter [Pseudomonas petroselini]MCD7070441.1 MFS transporter [Pseudomonas petroselini]